MGKSKKETVIVLGMHRSGTSLLSNILHSGGVKMVVKEKEKVDFDNLFGHYENTDIARLNDKLLDLYDSTWDKPLANYKFPPSENIDKYDKLCVESKKLIKLLSNVGNLVGIKDPRMSLVMKFWEPSIINPKYIYIFRNPVDVARSHQKRDDMPLKSGLKLWEVYNKSCLEFLRSKKYLMLQYKDILNSPLEAIQKIYEYIGIKPTDSQIQEAYFSINPDLQHSSTKDSELSEDNVPDSVLDLYKRILKDYVEQKDSYTLNLRDDLDIDHRAYAAYLKKQIKKIDGSYFALAREYKSIVEENQKMKEKLDEQQKRMIELENTNKAFEIERRELFDLVESLRLKNRIKRLITLEFIRKRLTK